jgi:hypothetical protein
MANEFGRNIQDAAFSTTKALPAATVTNVSDSFDLGNVGFKPEELEVEISVPAIAAHTTANNTTITLHDSADNSSFAEVVPMTQVKVLGVVSTGSVAILARFRLPPNVRRYIAFSQTAGATDTLTASSITYTLRF